jgi:GTPase SAR1 family protein
VGKTILGSSKLTNKDVLICNGGANDVYNSNSKKVILQIMKFLQDNDKSNIIMLDIPHRYDLPDNSHVNKDIKTFNSKMKKITKLFQHVTILEFSCTRDCFTQHGLHLNGYGKGLSAKQMASLIYKMSC